MKLNIIKQEKNPFLQREEFMVEISSDSVPSKSDVISEFKKDESLTVIKKINTNFGKQVFLTEIVVYNNIEAKEKIETIPQKIRKKMEADKKVAEEAERKKAEEAKVAKEISEKVEETEEPKEEEKSE
jgi:ribosomal protein S24E